MMVRHLVIPVYLFLCLLLGGASLAGYAANLLLQLMAIPLIALSLLTVRRTPMSQAARRLLVLAGLMVLLAIVQLVPLPPAVWTSLPGREGVAEGYRLLGQPLPWLPITMDPQGALAAFLWLLPALAVLLGIVRLGWFKTSWIAYAIIAAALAGLVVGTLQVASAQSSWYFYRVTNFGSAVGFFANANHMATLLVCSIPFAAALLLAPRPSSRRSSRHSLQRRSGRYLAAAGVGLILIVGLVLNRSLAGIGLAVPAVGLSAMMLLRRSRMMWRISAIGVGLVTLGALALIFLAPIGNNLTSAEASSSSESRRTSFAVTAQAAGDYLPLGSGLATFPEIYRSYEDPDTVEGPWMNHAHNDLLELALEFGIPGLLLIALFLFWWLSRSVAIWRDPEHGDRYAHAATIAAAAILLHSLVDYPLRTAGISALLAACLALMVSPRERQKRSKHAEPAGAAKHLSAD
jgi:O-antigen ligase